MIEVFRDRPDSGFSAHRPPYLSRSPARDGRPLHSNGRVGIGKYRLLRLRYGGVNGTFPTTKPYVAR